MQLRLCGREFDLRARALVIGVLQAPSTASMLVAQGADIVALRVAPTASPGVVGDAIAEMAATTSVPVACVTASAAAAEAAIAAGASLVHDPSGFSDPALLSAVAAGGAVVIADAGDDPGRLTALLKCARRAGVEPGSVVAGLAARPGAAWHLATSLDVPTLAMLPLIGLEVGETVGLAVPAIAAGCRLLTGASVRSLRRCADTCAELLEAR